MRERREGPAKGRKRSLEAAAAPRAVILHKLLQLLQLLSALLFFSTKTERNEIKTF
jgi:hypothetical protein